MKFKLLLAISIFIATLFACDKVDDIQPKCEYQEYELYVDNLIAQCQNFKPEDITKHLPGRWRNDSIFRYDNDWNHIVMTYYFKGVWSGIDEFYFNSDGTGEAHIYNHNDGSWNKRAFKWSYNEKNKKLLIHSQERGFIYNTIRGFNEEYMIIDLFDTEGYNTRSILKKDTL